jgi:hypothetical protein
MRATCFLTIFRIIFPRVPMIILPIIFPNISLGISLAASSITAKGWS